MNLRNILSICILVLLGQTAMRAQSAAPGNPQGRVASLREEAKAAIDSGRHEEAADIYRQLLGILRRDPQTTVDYGISLHRLRKFEISNQFLLKALMRNPGLSEGWLYAAYNYRELGDTGRSNLALEKYLALKPDDRTALKLRAQNHFAAGNFVQAIRDFEKLDTGDVQDPELWYGLGSSYQALLTRISAGLAVDSSYQLALEAFRHLALDEYPAAFYYFRRALEIDPQLRGLHAGLAEVYKASSQPEWASIEKKREAERGKPNCRIERFYCQFELDKHLQIVKLAAKQKSPESTYWAGRSYLELSRSAFSRLEEAGPSAEHHRRRAEVFQKRGRHADALSEWRAALEIRPDDRELQHGLVHSLLNNGDAAGAMAILDSQLASGSASPQQTLLKAQALFATGRVVESISFFKSALRHKPEPVEAHVALARIFMSQEEPEAALVQLEAARSTDPDGSLHLLLGQTYETLGRSEEAVQARAESRLRQEYWTRLQTIGQTPITAPE